MTDRTTPESEPRTAMPEPTYQVRIHRIAIAEDFEDALPKGFAAIDPERRSAISKKGIAALQQQGRAHHWNSETARAAALKSWAGRTRQQRGKQQ